MARAIRYAAGDPSDRLCTRNAILAAISRAGWGLKRHANSGKAEKISHFSRAQLT
jgi:hypothetical protein